MTLATKAEDIEMTHQDRRHFRLILVAAGVALTVVLWIALAYLIKDTTLVCKAGHQHGPRMGDALMAGCP